MTGVHSGISDRIPGRSAAERVASLVSGKPPVEPVVFPMVVADHASRIAGYSIAESVTQADTLARVLYTAWREYRYDMVMVFTDTVLEAEAMGAQVVISEDENPFLLESPRVEKLEPADPEKDGRMPVILEATRQLKKLLEEEVPVVTSIKGPFSVAAFLCGIERFLESTLERPEESQEFLRVAIDNQVRYAEAILRAGGIPFIGDPVASGSLIGPTLFRKFALPALAELVDRIQGLGTWTGVHVCGNTTGMVADICASGAEVASIEIDMAVARSEAGPDKVLMGSIPTSLVLEGPADRVAAAARENLEAGGPNTILSTGCDVPRDAPADNVKAIVESARGWIWP
jgi:uroporphyrinogen decarboxylase